MILNTTSVTPSELERETGFSIQDRGACKGELCIPLPGISPREDGTYDVHEIARALHLPVVEDAERGLLAIGPPAHGSRALQSAHDAEFELPDLSGRPFRLSSLRGRKVLVYAWAPY